MRLSRRQFVTSSSVALASGLCLSRLPLWAQETDGFHSLHAGAGIFIGRGGTIGWLATDEALVVVDSQFPASAENCLTGLGKMSSRGVDVLINTHHHGDHTAGNGVFESAKQIVAHSEVPRLQKQQAQKRDTESEQTYAGTTFDENWSIELGKETVTARHFGAAHTGGDSVVHFQNANVVHVGDLVFNRWHPFIDRAGGASVQGWVEFLDKTIKEYGEALYVFGHGHEEYGVTGTVKDVAHQRDFLSALLEWTRKGIKAGKTAEELGARETLEGFETHASPGERLSLAANVKVAYEELTADQ